MSYSGISYGPWHTVRVTATWYCEPDDGDPCRDPEGFCNGHDADGPGRELERDYEFEHPAECPVPKCCCTWPDRYSEIDPECEAGRHDTCLNRGYRCYTEESLFEWGDLYDEGKTAGLYRVRSWGSGPDHNGEYDAGIDWEPVAEAVASS